MTTYSKNQKERKEYKAIMMLLNKTKISKARIMK